MKAFSYTGLYPISLAHCLAINLVLSSLNHGGPVRSKFLWGEGGQG